MHYLWSAGRTPWSTGNKKLSLIYDNRVPLLPRLDPALCHTHSHTHTRMRAHKCAHISTHRHALTGTETHICKHAHACHEHKHVHTQTYTHRTGFPKVSYSPYRPQERAQPGPPSGTCLSVPWCRNLPRFIPAPCTQVRED